jgi:hypothetical protein
LQDLFNGATAFSQTLCWATSGKTITDMFTSSSGSIGAAINDANFFSVCQDWDNNRDTYMATYGDIKFWDTSAVTTMFGAFSNRYYFNDDISRWDTSNVINMQSVSIESITCCLGALRRSLCCAQFDF